MNLSMSFSLTWHVCIVNDERRRGQKVKHAPTAALVSPLELLPWRYSTFLVLKKNFYVKCHPLWYSKFTLNSAFIVQFHDCRFHMDLHLFPVCKHQTWNYFIHRSTVMCVLIQHCQVQLPGAEKKGGDRVGGALSSQQISTVCVVVNNN